MIRLSKTSNSTARLLAFSISLLIGALATAPQASAQSTNNDIVAVVGNKQITVKEFKEKYDEVLRQTINPPTKEQFLEDLVRYEMGVQEATKRKLEDDPIVKERIRQEVYNGLIEKNPEIRTSHILTEFRPDATAEQKKAARERATEIFNEVKKGKRTFEEYVGLYTDDVLSKRTGGDVGWQTGLTLVPAYYNTAMEMKLNEIRGLIETQYGFHVIKKTGVRSYSEANKRTIRAAVFDEKRKKIFDAYFAQLRKQYPVRTNKDKLP
jgi:peptidyl-prolyl cis-trans isomerase C/peptidyl-prolyl cis-trans isomerase D